MQYLKEEIKNKIIAAALEEFKDIGYEQASMRKIALKSGISAGNIYRYFNSKDALLDSIMQPVYDEIMTLANADQYLEETGDGKSLNMDIIMDTIMGLLQSHPIELYLIASATKGFKYAEIKGELTVLIQRRLKAEYGQHKQHLSDEAAIYVTAATFIEGVFLILKEYSDDYEMIGRLIRQLITLFFK